MIDDSSDSISIDTYKQLVGLRTLLLVAVEAGDVRGGIFFVRPCKIAAGDVGN